MGEIHRLKRGKHTKNDGQTEHVCEVASLCHNTNTSAMTKMNATVIGIGAMGGGMARSLLRSSALTTVVGYDKSPHLASEFYANASACGKADAAAAGPPSSLSEAVTPNTDAVVLVLVNEAQCEAVCFGGGNNLCTLLRPGSVVVLCSTVNPRWAREAKERIEAQKILFVDCPISGGAARAVKGELTMMASGDANALKKAKPILDACGSQVHIIEGGAGAGQTTKMAHQLLAGVHLVAAAEALALAARAGVDVQQMYDIVCGAAGASWFFKDRGSRMIERGESKVMSALPIIVKDMDIVYNAAKELRCPIPLASAALQQLLTAQAMRLDRKDDSEVVKVYEAITAKPVGTVVRGDGKDNLNGVECEIIGLDGKPGALWNGRRGQIEGYIKEETRYAILIDNSSTGNHQRVKVRRDNIKIVGGNDNYDGAKVEAPVKSLRDRLPLIKRKPIHAIVIGIGNIGGGMARALLRSLVTATVTAHDMASDLVSAFHKEARKAGKATSSWPPTNMGEAIGKETGIAILTLVNERQCQSVCFGGVSDNNLFSRLSAGSCVVLCSTVSAQWARYAKERFVSKGIHFVDCPVSGGAAKALSGELTMMASGDEMSLAIAMPILDAAGKEVHLIEGGAGMGQTVKYIHQSLAGIHIVAAAEAFALALRAKLDVHQFFNIVCGAAGHSWMLENRGPRMIGEKEPKVLSMVDIFVKDLGIVADEARGLKCPIPLSSVALQQFTNASALGLGKKDDSQVIRVYARYIS